MPSTRNHSIKNSFQADMVLVCHVDRVDDPDKASKDWLVESVMAQNDLTRMTVLFTSGETDAEDVKKHMELDVEFPVTSVPDKNRRRQMRQMYGYAYPVLDDNKTQKFPHMHKLLKKSHAPNGRTFSCQ